MQEQHDSDIYTYIYIYRQRREKSAEAFFPSLGEDPTGACFSPAVNCASTQGSQLMSQQPESLQGAGQRPVQLASIQALTVYQVLIMKLPVYFKQCFQSAGLILTHWLGGTK